VKGAFRGMMNEACSRIEMWRQRRQRSFGSDGNIEEFSDGDNIHRLYMHGRAWVAGFFTGVGFQLAISP
jgi:hypothetical protein